MKNICDHDWGQNIHYGPNFPKDSTDFMFGCMLYKCKKCGELSDLDKLKDI